MSDRPKARLFTIGPERPFLDDLADGIVSRVRALEDVDDPLALARTTVLLPTRRACQGLADAFLRRTGGAPTVLPRLLALGGSEDDEATLLDDGDGFGGTAGDLPPAIAPLRRQLLLARLVARWEPGESPDHAMRLAGALARWLDQVQTAEADAGALASLVPDALADHWRQTVEFLRIVTEHWPAILAAEGAVDPADRRNRLLAARAQAWRRHPPDGLVIAAGTTGSVPATATLLEVIAGLPGGMVVLPALDRHLEPAAWAAVLEDPAHPQHGLALLLRRLGSDADQVEAWTSDRPVEAPAVHDRAWLLSQAMRPAAVADRWPRLAVDADRVHGALHGLHRIDCPGPEEEAGVIAVLMREALQTPERTAALVTPDRGLARRVAAALRRWGIEIDDSAGVPLAETPTGVFLRLLAEACADDLAPLPLLSLLKHPLAAGGRAPGAFRADARLMDRRLLRGPRPAPGLAGLRARLAAADREHLPDPDRARLAALQDGLADRIGALAAAFQQDTPRPLGALLQHHLSAAEALAESDTESGADRLWAGEEGAAAARFYAALADAAADESEPVAPRAYPALLQALIEGEVVRPVHGRHPRLAILGLLEARLLRPDLIVLGGLNEGSWPPEPPVDPWMSRPMRTAFGLLSPERRIGLAAHDFAMAACGPAVVLTRSEKVEGTPTVPARWLLRLDSALKAAGLDPQALRATGPRYLGWLEGLDRPERRALPEPPAPTPPVAARPSRLSVTQIETWMRDPYAIYARHVLGLRALDPVDADPSQADYGSLVHSALDRFVAERIDPSDAQAWSALERIGREIFRPLQAMPGVWAFWWPRFERIGRWFLEEEAKRRRSVAESFTECIGTLEIDGPAGRFTLTARADRIDRLSGGGYELIDYKTGAPPTLKAVEAGFAPQLPLEAAILQAGGFEGVPSGPAAALSYWRLGGGAPPGEIKPVKAKTAPTSDALAEAALAGLKGLIHRFSDPAAPYHARPHPTHAPRYSDYVHLARVGEWASLDGESGHD